MSETGSNDSRKDEALSYYDFLEYMDRLIVDLVCIATYVTPNRPVTLARLIEYYKYRKKVTERLTGDYKEGF